MKINEYLAHRNMNDIAGRIHVYAAYFCLLYFFEIMYFMVLLFFVGGRVPSLIAGAILTPLLSYHIIMLYYKNPIHRKIQLYLMDLHFALSTAALIRLLFWDTRITAVFLSFMFIRVLIMMAEPAFIYFLTDRTVIDQF